MRVKENVRSGEILTETATGSDHTRIFDVDDIGATGAAFLPAATSSGDIPQVGQAHPVLRDVVVVDRQARPNGAKGARVTVRYGLDPVLASNSGGSASGAVEYFASVIQEEVVTDINGNKLVTAFTGVFPSLTLSSFLNAGTTSAETTIQYAKRRHRVVVDKPTVGVRVTRTERSLPKDLIFNMVGSVNSGAWSGFPARTWLCTSIDTRGATGGHEVTFSFSYKKNSWRAVLTSRIDGAIPNDVTSGNGIESFDVYPLANFNATGLRI